MNELITSELVEAMTQCHRKAFYIVHGTPIPDTHEYETIIAERTFETRSTFADMVERRQRKSTEQQSLELCVNGVLESGDLRADCDAVCQSQKRRAKGHHRAFEPHIGVVTHSVTKEQRLRLAFAGLVIGETRRYRPSTGWIIPMSSKPIRVSLNVLYPILRKAVADLRDLIVESSCDAPPLMLNSHCPLCPFRKHCRAEAEKTDILHLIQGEATVTLGDDAVEAQAGTWIHMPANLQHSVQTKTPVVMLLLLLKK
ncbi:MAG: hypothetical protein ABGZ35_11840 [Planctomycetaceae bacterium]